MLIPLPPAEDDQVRRARDIERRATEQAAARASEATTIGSGGMRVKDGGSIVVEAPGSIDLQGGAFSANSLTSATTVTAGGNITSTAGSVSAVNAFLTGQVSAASASITGAVTAGGHVSGSGGTFGGSLSSPGAYSTDITALGGARIDVWQHNSGVYGYTPSTIEKKTNLGPLPFTAADVLAVFPYAFQYRAQVAIREDPEHPEYDPEYVVPWDLGFIAEMFLIHNLRMFVYFEPDGATPKGINYQMFGAIAHHVVLLDHEARLQAAGI